MWKEVLSFLNRPCPENRLIRGVVVDVDPSIATLQARDVETGDIVTAAVRGLDDCADDVRDIVRRGGDAVRIECLVAPNGRYAVRMILAVHPSRVDELLWAGALSAEVAVVSLVTEVWREAAVPPLPRPEGGGDGEGRGDGGGGGVVEPSEVWREDEYPLFAHQHASVLWMRDAERRTPCPIRYAGNLRVTEGWYVDVEAECFTRDPAWRDARLVGGVCSDGTGTGKTATALRHLLTSPSVAAGEVVVPTRYGCAGTLVVLPLNLVSQWQSEVAKFLRPGHGKRLLWIVQGKDLRGLTMADVLAADAVFTTFHFLRGSKPYCELVERAIGRQRSRALLTSWARAPGHDDPLLEAVTWGRVVVDELHAALASPRDARQLGLLSFRALWGLTATPDRAGEHAQQLYLLLDRAKAQHHPNLLAAVVAHGIRGTASASAPGPAPQLRLVRLSDADRQQLRALSEAKTVEEVVKLCTFVDALDNERVGDADSIERAFLDHRRTEVAQLRARADAQDRVVGVLERASADLERELDALSERCAEGDELALARSEEAREAATAAAADLRHARRVRDAQRGELRRKEVAADLILRQLHALRRRSETCNICMERDCVAITPCAHLFCAECVRRHVGTVSPTCPMCRAPLQTHDLTRVTTNAAIHAKLTHIGRLVLGLDGQPIILFVQWKAMARGMRAFLRGMGVRVLSLDGNASQRAITLTSFLTGGVLLLCLEDSFEGLHLPHARHIVFAHAIVGDRQRVDHLERQAIARCVRHGQTGEVQVFSFVVADCEEERLWRDTHDG